MEEPFVLPETAAVLAGIAEQGGPHLADLSATDMRAVYLQMGALFDVQSEAGVRWKDLDGPSCKLRAYFPGEAAAGPVVLYMHGGGWVIGDLETHHPVCSTIAAITGCRVVAVDYRMGPEDPYPASHDDCVAAAGFVLGSPAELEAPVTGLATAGDSAGGNLAYYVAAVLGAEKVKAQLLVYPWLDCTAPDRGSYKAFGEGFILDAKLLARFAADYLPGDGDAAGPAASPLLHPLPAALPPAVILTAGLDPLRDQGRAMAGRMADAGMEVHFMEAAGLIHGLATMRAAFPTADRILRRAIGVFADLVNG